MPKTTVREHPRKTPSGRTSVTRHQRSTRGSKGSKVYPASYNSLSSDSDLSQGQRDRIKRMNNHLANKKDMDMDAVRELQLWWENDAEIYEKMEPLRTNLTKKALKGKLHDDASKLAFEPFYKMAQQKYFKSVGSFPISSPTKWKTIEEVWEYEIGEIKQDTQRILNANR